MLERIRVAVLEEVRIRGIKFTMDDLSLRLGMSKKTLYKYYKSKDRLIADVVDYLVIDIKKQRKEISLDESISCIQKLKAHFEYRPYSNLKRSNNSALADLKKYYPEEWDKFEQLRKESLDEMVFLLDKCIEEGTVRHLNTRVAATMIVATLGELLNNDEFLRENNWSPMTSVQVTLDMVFHGILSDNQKELKRSESNL